MVTELGHPASNSTGIQGLMSRATLAHGWGETQSTMVAREVSGYCRLQEQLGILGFSGVLLPATANGIMLCDMPGIFPQPPSSEHLCGV